MSAGLPAPEEWADGPPAGVEWPRGARWVRSGGRAFLSYELVVNGELAHDGDRVLARHVAAAVARQVPGGAGAWRAYWQSSAIERGAFRDHVEKSAGAPAARQG